ncbi:LuxR C-terminal-related transcriptional regulator [Actinokineospora sp. HUAS TT18]|uniref:helix-turn-helix transcriptional regulator n=1 Tax=Actinokineospora sp. HUAS TT18 TaxID=3447451 RepID=UPI003F52325F
MAADLRRAVRLLPDDPATAAVLAEDAANRDRECAAAFALAALARFESGLVDRRVVEFLEVATLLSGMAPDPAARRWISRLSVAMEATSAMEPDRTRVDLWLAAGVGRPAGARRDEDTAWLTFLADRECGDHLVALGGGEGLPKVHRVARVAWYSALAAAATSVAAATRWAQFAQRAVSTLAADIGRPLRTGHALLAWTHARLLLEPAEAAGWAVMAANAFGDPLYAGWSRLVASVAMAEAGYDEAARVEAGRARALLGPHSPALFPMLRLRADRARSRPVRPGGPTRRERVVLKLLADGLTAAAIARRLEISPRTVHHHLESLYRKLGTNDRLTTVRRAESIGLL